jgi:hypothetical protein
MHRAIDRLCTEADQLASIWHSSSINATIGIKSTLIRKQQQMLIAIAKQSSRMPFFAAMHLLIS